MKRLREELESSDPTQRAGAALLAKVPPFELSATQRRRIRAELDAAHERRGFRWLKPAFALPVLLMVGVAGASIGQRWLRPATPQRVFEAEPAHALASQVQVVPVPHAATAVAPGELRPEDLAAQSDVAEAKRGPSPSVHAADSGPGAALMMEALQARRAGDSARAQELTAEYQRKYPNGALREEALAIAMESAASRNDASAARLAQRYLASFPHGRFRKQADQVLANQR
jgi:hypothetical protein